MVHHSQIDALSLEVVSVFIACHTIAPSRMQYREQNALCRVYNNLMYLSLSATHIRLRLARSGTMQLQLAATKHFHLTFFSSSSSLLYLLRSSVTLTGKASLKAGGTGNSPSPGMMLVGSHTCLSSLYFPSTISQFSAYFSCLYAVCVVDVSIQPLF